MFRSVLRTYRAAYRGVPRAVWVLSLALVVNRAGSMVLPFIMLYLTRDQGLSVTDAGRVMAVWGVGAIVGSFLGGWFADRVGATRIQLVSLGFSGVGYLWLSMLDGYGEICAGVFFLSIAVEAFRPAMMADVAHRAPPDAQARAFAALRLAANLGVGIGPAVGGFLALYDYKWLFYADAATCWAAAVLLAFMIDPHTPIDAGAAGETARGVSPWKDGPFLLLMSLVIVIACTFFQFFSTLPIYFREVYDFREDTIGLLLAFNPLLIVIFEMVLIHWAEKRNRVFFVGLGAFLVCAGLGMQPFGSSLGFVVFTISVWTLGEMLALPLVNALVADRADPSSRGRYMGLYTMAFSIAFVFAPAAGTWIYDRLGPDVLWYGIGLLGPLLWVWALALVGPLGRDVKSRPHPRA